jgi:hypothetical protein
VNVLRHLGRLNVEVSVVGLGCHELDQRVDAQGTRRSLATADVYGAVTPGESLLGEAVASGTAPPAMFARAGRSCAGPRRAAVPDRPL